MRKKIFFWAVIIAVLFTVQCTVDEDQITSPTGDIDQYVLLKSFSADDSQIYAGDDSTEVHLALVRPDDQPAEGIAVTFMAERLLGSITAIDTSDAAGIATALYTAGSSAGIEKIVANTGSKEDSLFIILINKNVGLTITVDQDSTEILADGTMQVAINATAINLADDTPEPDLRIYFKTDFGTIEPSDLTDENGTAHVLLTSISDSSDISATVIASLEELSPPPLPARNTGEGKFKIADNRPIEKITRKLITETNQGEAPTILSRTSLDSGAPSDTVNIIFRGITIEIQSSRTQLLADGLDISEIYVTISETTTGNPVSGHSFRPTASKGVILGSATTNDLGRATLQLRSGTRAGSSTVTVSIGDVEDQLEIEFISAVPTSLILTSASSDLLANGISTNTITATVFDTLNKPIEGETITLTSSLGNINQLSTITDENGQVTAVLTSIASPTDTSIFVVGTIGGVASLNDTISISLLGLTLESQVSDNELVANGSNSTSITATVKQTTYPIPVPDQTVYFRTNLGAITSSAETDAFGNAVVDLVSGFSEGIAEVVIQYSTLENDTVLVNFLPSTPTSFNLQSDAASVHADGLSTIGLTANITDTLDNPVEGTWVYFSTDMNYATPVSALTDANGDAQVDFPAPASTVDLNGWIRASLTSPSTITYSPGYGFNMGRKSAEIAQNIPAPLEAGQSTSSTSLSDSIQISFIGITVTAVADDEQIVGDGFRSTEITATVRETVNGVTLQDKPVYFTAKSGLITPEVSTNEFGIASATLTSALTPGIDTIKVRFGSELYDTVTVEYLTSDPANISIETSLPSILANGFETMTVTATVLDTLDNPLFGQAVQFSTDSGDDILSGTAAYTDENGQAAVELTSTASAVDIPVTVTVSISGVSSLEDSTQVIFRGITINTSASATAITADGESSTNITVTLSETTSLYPVAGQEVIFTPTNTNGLMDRNVITDQSGIAVSTFYSGNIPGTATIYVSTGNTLTDEIQIELLNHLPRYLYLSTDEASILANGSGSTGVSTLVTDTLGVAVSNIAITLSTDAGEIGDLTGTTDENGYFYTTITSTADSIDATASISGEVDNLSTVNDTHEIIFRGVTMELSASPEQISADGISESTISIQYRETSNSNPVANANIFLGSTHGTIPPVTTTNTLGRATEQLISNTSPATAQVTATAGYSKTTTVEFVDASPFEIILEADDSSILADGLASTTLTVFAADILGNAVNNGLINIATSSGTLSDSVLITNSIGQASFNITSSVSTIDVPADITCASDANPSVTDSITIEFRGITLGVTASPNQIAADGQSTATLTGVLQESTTGNPIDNRSVSWSTTLGIIPATSVTNNLGITTTTLNSVSITGTAVITATAGVSATDSVEFLATLPTAIAVSATETSLLADGESTTLISVLLTDTLDAPVASQNINLTWDYGLLNSAIITTDIDGTAEFIYTSGVSTTDRTAVITAAADGFPAVADSVEITNRGLNMTVVADPLQIRADGSSGSTITIQLSETTSGHPVAGHQVNLNTNLGNVSQSEVTNAAGTATATLNSGTVPGLATVIAEAGISDSTSIEFLPITPSYIALSASESSIIADASSSTVITASITDTLGIAVEGVTVNFTAEAGALDENSAITDLNGEATVVVTSAASSGDLEATITSTVPGFLTDSLTIAYRGLTFSATADPDQIIADGNSTSTISLGLVETTNGNPAAGKTIVLTTDLGSIIPTVATNASGQATAVLTSGTTTGTATIAADAGVTTSTTVEIESIAPANIGLNASANSILANQLDNTEFTATVTDILNNPLAGVTVLFTSDQGTLSADSAVTNINGQVNATLLSSASTSDQTATVRSIISGFSSVRDSLEIDLRGITLTVTANPEIIPADGLSTSSISFDLQETVNGNPVAGNPIILTTTAGSIVANVQTDASGLAAASLTSSSTPESATVTAQAGITETAAVVFAPISFSISADGTELEADGTSSLQISASLQNQVTGNPLQGKTVYWTTTLGSIPASSVTGGDGVAVVNLTAGSTTGTAKVKGIYTATHTDSVSITFNAVTDSTIILSWINPGGSPGNGTDVLSITAIFIDENGNPVAGDVISFSVTPNTYGAITTGITTNASGTATAGYTYSGQYSGQTIRVTATSSSGSVSGDIDIVLSGIN